VYRRLKSPLPVAVFASLATTFAEEGTVLKRTLGSALAAVLVTAVLVTTASAVLSSAGWSMSGQGITNWRYQPDEHKITVSNVKGLSEAWEATLAGDISSTPAVVDGVVYVTDWGGKISALDAGSGALIWQQSVATLVGLPGTVVSRTAPAVSGNSVVFGTQKGAWLVSVDKRTGAPNWATQLDTHPLAIITQSPTIYDGVVYDGVASTEENGVDCGASVNACYFRGSEHAVDLASGANIWTTYTITSAQSSAGYSGAAVWGSSPAIDVARHSVYVTTGNNYGVPPSVKACADAAGDDLAALAACEPQNNGNYVDAVLSLDLGDGHLKWANKVQGYDAWTTACIGFPTACPTPTGPDFDFGQGAMLIPLKDSDIVVAGQKSGILWGVDPDTGATIWRTLVGPGSSLGGLEWGSATDGKRVYFAVVNLGGVTYSMVNPPKGTPATSISGSWGAVDPATGVILWQTADPNGAIDLGPVSVSNGVVYASSFGGPVHFFPGPPNPPAPTMFALDASNGKQLWSFTSGGSVNAGPAIANGRVYWGSGYSNLGLGDPNKKLFAFTK
jgi:polyvinyl alcohol dehydrogenase (cytochrome)